MLSSDGSRLHQWIPVVTLCIFLSAFLLVATDSVAWADPPQSQAPSTQPGSGQPVGAGGSTQGNGTALDTLQHPIESLKGWISEQFDALGRRVETTIAQKAQDATTAFISAALTPQTMELRVLTLLVTDKPPPGQLSPVHNFWTEAWWAAIGLLVLAGLVQATRIITGRSDEVDRLDHNRLVTWLLLPLVGAILARLTLFAVDLSVSVQNHLWSSIMPGLDSCAMVYASCAGGVGPGALAGVGISLVTWMPQQGLGFLFEFLYLSNWLFLCGIAVVGPIYVAISSAGRSFDSIAGWFGVFVRTTVMQSIVGLGLTIQVQFQAAARTASGTVGILLQALDATGFIRTFIILVLTILLIVVWLIPSVRAAFDVVTLRGGETIRSVGGFAKLAGGILMGAGVVTANPGLIAAGQKTAMAGSAASAYGQSMQQQAAARQQAFEQRGIGGWILKAAPVESARSLAARAVTGASPIHSFQVSRDPQVPADAARVSLAPGLALTSLQALASKGVAVDAGGQRFQVTESQADLFWTAAAHVLTKGKDGSVQHLDDIAYTVGVGDDALARVAPILKQQQILYQVGSDRITVARKEEKALREAVAMASIDHTNEQGALRFGLPAGHRGADLLNLLTKGRVAVTPVGEHVSATVQMTDKNSAPEIQGILAGVEDKALKDRPGYYRYGTNYVVVQMGKPLQETETPPEGGIYLGPWPGK